MGLRRVLEFVRLGIRNGNLGAAVALLDVVIPQVDGVATGLDEALEAAEARAAVWEFVARATQLRLAGRWDEFAANNAVLLGELAARAGEAS
jgi:hypothetical protein